MKYYVYVLARPDGSPFYVGKGKGKRIYHHEAEAAASHRCHKCNVIRKVWAQGGQVQRYFVFTTDDEQEAYDYEIELITLYGRDTLTNQTDGGEGHTGYVSTEAQRNRRSKMMKELLSTPEGKEKWRESSMKRWQDLEYRQRTIAAIRHFTSSDRHRIHMKRVGRLYWDTPGSKEKARQRMLTRYKDPDQRERTRQQLAQVNATPESRARKSQIMKERMSDPDRIRAMVARTHGGEAGRKRGEASKRMWKDPEKRAKLVEQIKQQQSTPESKERMSVLSKARWADKDLRARAVAKLKATNGSPEARESSRQRMLAYRRGIALERKERLGTEYYEVRKLYATGDYTISALARRIGLSEYVTKQICTENLG